MHTAPLRCSLIFCSLLTGAATTARAAPGDALVGDAPNLYGQTGVLRTTSARVPDSLVLDVAASGFGSLATDFIVPGDDDFDAFLGGYLSASLALLDVVELSLAMRSASNSNTARGPSQFSVGDLYPSLKLGLAFLPVAVGVDVRAHLPTRVDAAGYDIGNYAVTGQGLVTLDLHERMDIPLRAHLNGGYVFQGGKDAQGDDGLFEDNPNFYNGVDGHLLALAADAWFYDQVVAGLGVEVPLPYVTPFLEAWYQTAVGVPEDRGAGGNPYDPLSDAHLTLSPGARLTPGGGLSFDVAVDIGVLGTGGGGTDVTKLVDGTPINPLWAGRVGVTYTFAPFHASRGAAGATGQIKGCVTDAAGQPVDGAVVDGPALAGARLATDEAGCFLTPFLPAGDTVLTVRRAGFDALTLTARVESAEVTELAARLAGGSALAARVVGYVTNKDDETLEADLELWDARGVKSAGQAVGGAFDLQAAPGDIVVVAKADGYLADGAALVVNGGERGRAIIVLQKVPKTRMATLERDRIQTAARVPFEFKKPRLQSTASYVLGDVVDVLLRHPALRVRVDVYSELLGTPEESQQLADDRAREVVDHLASRGVWRSRLEWKGTPLTPATESDKNRRVEFVIIP